MHSFSAATRSVEAASRHFLLSKQARTLSVDRITRLTEDAAFREFVAIRFCDSGGKPVCYRCGAGNPYEISTRQKWKCSNRDCQSHFSATTATPFAGRKLSYRKILIAIAKFNKVSKGINAITLSRDLEIDHKTAFVLLHKLRERIGEEQAGHKLQGVVEIDGGYNGGYVRPHNIRSKRLDRRATRYSEKRKCVVVMRERWGRSRTFICSESEATRLVPDVIEPGSTIITDSNPSYNRLHGAYRVLHVNHEERYADGEASTNWAESFFARLDRAEKGVYHRIAGDHFGAYANEMSWREDTRRQSDLENYDAVCRLMTRGGVSRKWKGYWQRRALPKAG